MSEHSAGTGRASGRAIGTCAGALGFGLVCGLVLTLAHALLPDQWAVLAGTSALWSVVGLIAGRWSAGRADIPPASTGALAGLIAMVGVLLPWLAVNAPSTSAIEVTLWIVVGPVAGAVCGAAGALSTSPGTRGSIAAGVVPGIIGGEAVYGIWLIGGPAWPLEAVLALVVLAIVSRPGGRGVSLASMTLLVSLSAAACLVYDAVA